MHLVLLSYNNHTFPCLKHYNSTYIEIVFEIFETLSQDLGNTSTTGLTAKSAHKFHSLNEHWNRPETATSPKQSNLFSAEIISLALPHIQINRQVPL